MTAQSLAILPVAAPKTVNVLPVTASSLPISQERSSGVEPPHWTYMLGSGHGAIKIRLTPIPGGWVAEQPDTGIFGYATAPSDAVLDLRTALKQHLAVLTKSEALSDHLALQLQFLKTNLASDAG
jgi:hypothetical protein